MSESTRDRHEYTHQLLSFREPNGHVQIHRIRALPVDDFPAPEDSLGAPDASQESLLIHAVHAHAGRMRTRTRARARPPTRLPVLQHRFLYSQPRVIDQYLLSG